MLAGRAAYGLSPLSSLGGAHALGTGTVLATALNTCFQSSRERGPILRWARRELLLAAAIEQAHTALGHGPAASLWPTPYWQQRTDPSWILEGCEAPIRGAVQKALELQKLQEEGAFANLRLREASVIETGRALFAKGPMVRERPSVSVPGGLPVERELWEQLGALRARLRGGARLEAALRAEASAIAPGPSQDAMERRLAQDLSRLYRRGLLATQVGV